MLNLFLLVWVAGVGEDSSVFLFLVVPVSLCSSGWAFGVADSVSCFFSNFSSVFGAGSLLVASFTSCSRDWVFGRACSADGQLQLRERALVDL